MRNSNSQVDLLNGPTFKSMLLFSVPIILQGSFQIIYNLVDRFWVGQLAEGKESLGAVSVGFSLFFFMVSLVIGISIGAGIMIAQFRGAENKKKVNLVSRNFIAFGAITVFFLSFVMVSATEPVLRLNLESRGDQQLLEEKTQELSVFLSSMAE